METVVVAVITAIPATLASLAAWRKTNQTHAEVRTNHGKRAGEYLETLSDDVLHLKNVVVTKGEFRAHTEDDNRFQAEVMKRFTTVDRNNSTQDEN